MIGAFCIINEITFSIQIPKAPSKASVSCGAQSHEIDFSIQISNSMPHVTCKFSELILAPTFWAQRQNLGFHIHNAGRKPRSNISASKWRPWDFGVRVQNVRAKILVPGANFDPNTLRTRKGFHILGTNILEWDFGTPHPPHNTRQGRRTTSNSILQLQI